MPNTLTKEDVKDLIGPLIQDIAEIKQLIKEQNSKLAATVTDVAILKDRQPERKAIMWGSAAGGFVGAIGLLLDFFVRK